MATLRNWSQVREPVPYLRRAVLNGARGVLRRREIAERFRPDLPPASAPEQLVELRDVLLALPYFDHMHRFLPALVQRQGGRVESIVVSHRPRTRGRSKYGVHNRLWVGIVDLFGVAWLQRRARLSPMSDIE